MMMPFSMLAVIKSMMAVLLLVAIVTTRGGGGGVDAFHHHSSPIIISSTTRAIGTTVTTTFSSSAATTAATTTTMRSSSTTTRLYMGKGLNKFKNKQADLKRKMELAKKQKREEAGETVDDDDDDDESETKQKKSDANLTDQEIKERNDRKRFEQLLKQQGSKVLNDYTSDAYLNIKQEEEEITAARAGVDRIFEGDPAPTDCFENLISMVTEKALAKKGSGKLVPWISKDWGIDPDDYRVIICDPRKQSDEFRQTMKDLNGMLPKDIKDRLYFVNSDTPAENRRWMKKNGLLSSQQEQQSGSSRGLEIYSDNEDMDWMKTYTALGDKRWSMTMFIISKGRVVKLARDLDIYNASRTVVNAVKAMKNEK